MADESNENGEGQFKPKPPELKPDSAMRNAGLAITIPTLMAASVLVGCLIGYYLDRWLHSRGILFLVFLVLGIVAGVREVRAILRKLNDGK
ncbi:MAG: AtpZ/AtpI family protein [Candidatus Sumerlaeaceae bacterium]|nr:AtpZ/AtpI family protein [Candidatus Sumerlaeaceae bacterium]